MSGNATDSKNSSSTASQIESIKASLFDSLGNQNLIQNFVEQVGAFYQSEFTVFAIHASDISLERIVGFPEITPAQLKLVPKMNQFMEEQPIVKHLIEHKSELIYSKISDFLPVEAFRKTNLYKEGFGPMRLDFMLTAGVWNQHGKLYCLHVTHPDRDFDETDRTNLKAIFPIFLKAYQLQQMLKIESQEIINVLDITEQQKRVYHWIGQGKTNQEIATIMDLSPKTVEKHIRNLCKLLKVKKRVELLSYSVQQEHVSFPALQK